MLKTIICATLFGLIVILIYNQVESCNEALCGSIVSKCLLTQSCKCDLKNCTCCKDCFNCLSYLYSDCCSCVDMCPRPSDTETILSKKSYIEDLPENVPDLFKALTDSPDEHERWNSTTFPVDIDISQYGPKKEIKIHMQSAEQEVAPIKTNVITVNCTVAYISPCMSTVKCKGMCTSMGASSYRWFHDGCCECIGQHCINYGINESRCSKCPLDDVSEEELDEEDYEYDDEDNHDDLTDGEDSQ